LWVFWAVSRIRPENPEDTFSKRRSCHDLKANFLMKRNKMKRL
jgi:hypothetical protein